MKNNTPPAAESVSPLVWKIILAAAIILVMGLLIFTVRSISHVLSASSSPPIAAELNAKTVSVPPLPSGETVPDNSRTTVSAVGQPPTLAAQFEIVHQREQAQKETIEALKREARETAGTNALSREELRKIEKSDPYIQ